MTFGTVDMHTLSASVILVYAHCGASIYLQRYKIWPRISLEVDKDAKERRVPS